MMIYGFDSVMNRSSKNKNWIMDSFGIPLFNINSDSIKIAPVAPNSSYQIQPSTKFAYIIVADSINTDIVAHGYIGISDGNYALIAGRADAAGCKPCSYSVTVNNRTVNTHRAETCTIIEFS